MPCSAVSPWGAGCVLGAGHPGDHLTEDQRTAREAAAVAWRAARDEFWAAVAQRAKDRAAAKVKEVLSPVVLVPTPAQRRAGVRVVDARPEQIPASARRLVKTAGEAGWSVRVTYSHALMPPKRGAEDWWDNHTVAVRLAHPGGGRAWGVWATDGDAMKWDGGQVWTPGTMVRNVGAKELGAFVSDASLDSQVRQLVGSVA